MTSKERLDLCTLLEKNTGMTWWVNENDRRPYYTAECEKIKFKQDFENSQELRIFIKGVSIGYLTNAIQRLNEQLDAEKAKAKRKRLNAAFNPWKFCGNDKLHPQFMLCHFSGGFAKATDSHHLIIEKFDYPAELEDKCVNDDMQPSTAEYRYPDFKAVLVKDDEYSEPFTLEHDASWFAVTAKQMKADAKRELMPFVKIGGKYFDLEAAEYLAYWLKYHTPVVFLSRKNNGPIQLADADGNIFLQMPRLAPQDGQEPFTDEEFVIYE